MGRSRYKYYWYGIVVKMIQQYPLSDEKSMQAAQFRQAIANVMEDTKKLPNGEDRLKAVQLVYIQRTDTVEGAAQKLYTSTRTVQRWLSAFVYAVGRAVGF